MERYDTHDFDLIEHIPPSSHALTEKIGNILKHSTAWNADITNIDKSTGNYRLILNGVLKQQLQEKSN